MKKLILELYRVENLVFGRVEYMDESLRGVGMLAENSTFAIISGNYPSLVHGVLYVDGYDIDANGTIFSQLYENTTAAKEVVKNICELVDEINRDKKIEIKESLVIEKIL